MLYLLPSGLRRKRSARWLRSDAPPQISVLDLNPLGRVYAPAMERTGLFIGELPERGGTTRKAFRLYEVAGLVGGSAEEEGIWRHFSGRRKVPADPAEQGTGEVTHEAQIQQQPLQARPGPACGADQIATHVIRNARQRHELMHRFVALTVLQRECQLFLDEPRDSQTPPVFINFRRNRIDIDPVMPFQKRKSWPGTRRRLHRRVRVRQRMGRGPSRRPSAGQCARALRRRLHRSSARAQLAVPAPGRELRPKRETPPAPRWHPPPARRWPSRSRAG